MTGKPWSKRREPWSDAESFETEAGTHLEVGDEVLVKPTYVDARLPATVERIYWEPQGLPGGKFDHRGREVGTGDDGLPEYEHPDRYDCILNVAFRLNVPEDDKYSHLDGKQERIEGYNLDFCVGTGREIRRDRGNCNAEPFTP